MAVEEYDPMHILHPNNATALKATTAVLQLARRQYKEMHDSEFITKKGPTGIHLAGSQRLSIDWICPVCTLLNKGAYLQCDACGCEAPQIL
eukprot:gene31598-38187_t